MKNEKYLTNKKPTMLKSIFKERKTTNSNKTTSLSPKTSNTSVIFTTPQYDIISCTVQQLTDTYNIKNWDKNRPADPVRVSQIKQYYSENNISMVDGIICGWLVNDTIYIYDGIHRLNAALEIFNETQTQNLFVIVKIVKAQNENVVINDFKCINSSVSIPYLYLENENELKRNVCESVMKKMCNQWSNCVSPSRNPRKSNFNRDNFIEHILSKVNINFQKPNVDMLLFQTILGINDKAKSYITKNNIECFKKNHTNNFYIMYFNNQMIITEIESSHLLK